MEEVPWHGIPPPPLEVIEAAILAGRRLVARIDRDLEASGLTWGLFHVLVVMERQRGLIHAGAVARRMGVSRQAAHVLMRRLGDAGLIRWDEQEAWVRSARLSDDGRGTLASAYADLADVLAAIERLTVDERKMVVAAAYSMQRELNRRPGWGVWEAIEVPRGNVSNG
jgi:DNA-binding MarR family transcriptional regulator